MSDPADLSDEQMLARLAACDLSAAERVHGRLMAAEATAELAELGRTYQRITRSLRQTLALKARLRRELEQGVRDTTTKDAASPSAPSPAGGVAVARRLREVHAAVARVIWDEVDREDVEFLDELLAEEISADRLGDDFCSEPLDDHVARLCLSLGLSPEGAEGWRDLPDPPDDADEPPDEPPDEPGERRSSG